MYVYTGPSKYVCLFTDNRVVIQKMLGGVESFCLTHSQLHKKTKISRGAELCLQSGKFMSMAKSSNKLVIFGNNLNNSSNGVRSTVVIKTIFLKMYI